VIEEGRKKKPRTSRYEKNPLKTTKKLKKKTSNLSLFGYSAIPTKAAMVLEGQKNSAHLHEKRTFFFVSSALLFSPKTKQKNSK
jgi:hypothetical protein